MRWIEIGKITIEGRYAHIMHVEQCFSFERIWAIAHTPD
jgi:hypothetical protein